MSLLSRVRSCDRTWNAVPKRRFWSGAGRPEQNRRSSRQPPLPVPMRTWISKNRPQKSSWPDAACPKPRDIHPPLPQRRWHWPTSLLLCRLDVVGSLVIGASASVLAAEGVGNPMVRGAGLRADCGDGGADIRTASQAANR